MTYTVTGGKNEPNVVVADGGYQNPPQSGTAANGITPTGQADAGSSTYVTPGLSGFQASVNAAANLHFGDGIIALPQFTSGMSDGVNGLETDSDNTGHSFGGKIGYGINMPDTGPGAERIFFGFSGQSIWGKSTTRINQIMAPGSSIYEIAGLNVLSNIATNQVDDVKAETEIDELEFNIRMGLIYEFGAYGATIGNLLFGNLGPADQQKFRLAILGDLFYRYGERHDMLSFFNSGVSNLYDSTIESREFGARVSVMAKVPVLRGLTFNVGPSVGLYNSNDDLSVNYLRGAASDSFRTTEENIGYELGLTTGLTAELGWGKLSVVAAYKYKSDSPMLHLRESNSDTTGIDYTDSQQLTVGAKLRIPLPPRSYQPNRFNFFNSDARLKTDIVRLGALPSGLPVYSFKYVWSPVTHVGVMAQEAMVLFPYAVHEVDGFLAVDYSRIR